MEILTVFLVLLGLAVMVFGLFLPWPWMVIPPNERGIIVAFGRKVGDRGPGPQHVLPWEDLLRRNVRQQKGSIPVTELSTGTKDNPMTFGVDVELLFRIVDVERSVFELKIRSEQELQDALVRLVRSSLQTSLQEIGGNALTDGRLTEVFRMATEKSSTQMQIWGMQLDAFLIERIIPPAVQIETTEIRERAKAEADAVRSKSEAEVEAYRAQRIAEGDDYRFHQVLDALQEMAKTGAFRFYGGGNVLAMVEDFQKSESGGPA